LGLVVEEEDDFFPESIDIGSERGGGLSIDIGSERGGGLSIDIGSEREGEGEGEGEGRVFKDPFGEERRGMVALYIYITK
jgi:hypothetical protein